MLATTMDTLSGEKRKNTKCLCGNEATIIMSGYAESGLDLCSGCALQLARKITEDLCELLTVGGRHG